VVPSFAVRDSGVCLIEPSPLPPGWAAKTFACQKLSEAACSLRLVFMDADVRPAPGGTMNCWRRAFLRPPNCPWCPRGFSCGGGSFHPGGVPWQDLAGWFLMSTLLPCSGRGQRIAGPAVRGMGLSIVAFFGLIGACCGRWAPPLVALALLVTHISAIRALPPDDLRPGASRRAASGGPNRTNERKNQPFQLSFKAAWKSGLQGSRVTSAYGLILVGKLEERLGLGQLLDEHLRDPRRGQVRSAERKERPTGAVPKRKVRAYDSRFGTWAGASSSGSPPKLSSEAR